MNVSKTWLAGLGACASLGLAAAVYAAPGPEHAPGNQTGAQQHGMHGGHMNAEEGKAHRDQMASATPEQRRQLGQARHAQMHGSDQAGEHRRGPAQGKGPRSHNHGDASTGEHSH